MVRSGHGCSCSQQRSCPGILSPYAKPTHERGQPFPNQPLVFENNAVQIQTEKTPPSFSDPAEQCLLLPASPQSYLIKEGEGRCGARIKVMGFSEPRLSHL